MTTFGTPRETTHYGISVRLHDDRSLVEVATALGVDTGGDIIENLNDRYRDQGIVIRLIGDGTKTLIVFDAADPDAGVLVRGHRVPSAVVTFGDDMIIHPEVHDNLREIGWILTDDGIKYRGVHALFFGEFHTLPSELTRTCDRG